MDHGGWRGVKESNPLLELWKLLGYHSLLRVLHTTCKPDFV